MAFKSPSTLEAEAGAGAGHSRRAPGIYRQHEPDTNSAARMIQISAISCSHHVARFSA